MDAMDDAAELDRLAADIQRRRKEREPARIGDVVSRLLSQRGYSQSLNAERLRQVWAVAAGPQLAAETQPGNIRRGVLEVFASDSCLIQELTFRKAQLLDKLRQVAPDLKVGDLRFKVAVVD